MDIDEVINLLKDRLTVRVDLNKSFGYYDDDGSIEIKVSLLLDDTVISESKDSVSS